MWIIPVIALVISGAVLFTLFRRWHVRGDVHATAADRALVEQALVVEPDDPEQGSGR